MAENPATWGEAERIVNEVLNEYHDHPYDFCGLTLERAITDALRDAELLQDERNA